jgi:hypothetical protein
MTACQNRGVEIVVYCTYGDESRDRTKQRVYAVAGVFGHQTEWDEISALWAARLGGRIFHAADCEAGYGDFKDMEAPERHKLYRDLTTLLVKSKLLGHGEAINIQEYNEAFPGDFDHAPYMWAFGNIVQSMAELAAASIPPQQVEITFDQNQEIQYNATAVYNLMIHSPKTNHREFLFDKLSFACRRTVGVQIADLFARETMKHLDGMLGSQSVRRGSFAALTDTNRFRFRAVGRTDFVRSKQKLEALGLEDASLDAYRKWLTENGLHDCLSNRIAHLQEFPQIIGGDSARK